MVTFDSVFLQKVTNLSINDATELFTKQLVMHGNGWNQKLRIFKISLQVR